jgi:hypothetical protein
MEQLLFLQIFNFYRKFESNLQNGVSGSFVNISKSISNHRAPPSYSSVCLTGAPLPLFTTLPHASTQLLCLGASQVGGGHLEAASTALSCQAVHPPSSVSGTAMSPLG